jgi:arylsulfatase A-like enzyme
LRAGANLWSVFPDDIPTYPELLAISGYEFGMTGKGWGPGRTETQGRPIAGKPYANFRAFLEERDPEKPFCFWLGTTDPHRPYELGSGEASGMDLSAIRLPACFPDDPIVRGDVADYYFEVQRFDRLVGSALDALAEIGELDGTIIVMTGDHGMPFPRGKASQYDTGTRVPLAVRFPPRFPKGRTIDDFVSLTDLAPTFLEAAGLAPTDDMTGRSLIDVLETDKSGRIDPRRDHVLSGKERHVPSQEKPDMGG